MVIVLSGPDTFRSRERLRQLREAFVKKYDPSGVNVVSLDGSTLKFEDFQQAVASRGLLSSRRFVMVERPFDADRKIQEAVAKYLNDPGVPKEAILVFWLDVVASKRGRSSEPSTLVRLLASVEHHEKFELLDPREVERWIAKRVKERGGTIEPAAVEHLASAVGSDLWMAANELDKLLHQTNGKITREAVEGGIAVKTEADIFAFSDALSRKDSAAALELLERQFESGANELYVLSMIARQIRILLAVGDLAITERNPATVASRLKLHPFVVRKAFEQIRTFSQRELLAAHDALVALDATMKSTQDDPRALLELFVLRFCGPTPRRAGRRG